MSVLEFRKVWKRYGEQVVLERVDAKVKEGEFITIVGASGCGKSTFLNMLLGSETPSSGSILLDGKPLPPEPSAERGIVFQRYSVFPHLTALGNVRLALELSGKAPRRKSKVEAQHWLEQVGLSAAANRYPQALSGGMQQRLALAQTLCARPRILLLDEPFGALDPGIRADMHALTLSLWREHKLTVFMVTHDLREGFYLGTRLWVFDKERWDPQAPNAYGARITYDLPVGQCDQQLLQQIEGSTQPSTPAVEATP